MSEHLADSPAPGAPRRHAGSPQADPWLSHQENRERSAETAFELLSSHRWDGLELLHCREDIRQPTEWGIGGASCHTVIVHLGGSMRRLETRIEGTGGVHGPPAPGDIWLVPSKHHYASLAQGHLITYAELRIDPEIAVDVPDARGATLDGLAPRIGHRDEFLYHAVAQLSRLSNDGDDLAVMMAERLQLLLRQHLFRDYRLSSQTASRRPAALPALGPLVARRINDHIQDNLDQRIVLDQLAALADMSVHRFLIAFRGAFGATPAQYILSQRLRRAREHLLNGNADIARIANACGFANHSHLTSAFKRAMGLTPSQFRQGLRTRAQPD